tara:strand:- start:1746 stop:2156 length:411 start_codon:yes stop_codon:yes gene_type:complete
MSIKYNIHHSFLAGEESVSISTVINEVFHGIPLDNSNGHYQQYLEHIKTHGMSIVSCDDCGDGVPNDSMWQYLDNAEQLVIDKYGSDSDKLTALREHKYVRSMEGKFPYESMTDAGPIIDSTPQEIKQKYNLPMRR